MHTVPLDDDYLLASEKKCHHFDYVMLKYMNGSEYKGYFEKYASLIEHLEENAEMKLETITLINTVYDGLYIEKLKGKRYLN